MKLHVRTFEKGLEELTDFVNEVGIKPGEIQLVIREGQGYKMLFWAKKVKASESDKENGPGTK